MPKYRWVVFYTIALCAFIVYRQYAVYDEVLVYSNFLQGNKKTLTQTNPMLVLHVGPPKTGTTTLQKGLYKWRKSLLRDSFFYIARPDDTRTIDRSWTFYSINQIALELKQAALTGGGLNHTYNTIQEKKSFLKRGQGLDFDRSWDLLIKGRPIKTTETNKFSELVKVMDEQYQKNQNVIISAEQFCFNDRLLPDHESSWDLFLTPMQKWNVQIVVAYRRFYEFLPSFYFQRTQGTIAQKNIVTFATFIEDVMQQAMTLKTQERWFEAHPTYHAILKFKRHFTNVNVFNIHTAVDNDIVKSFICEILPNANHTCSYISSVSDNATVIHRQSHNMDFYLLIKHASDKKMLPAFLSGKKLIKGKLFKKVIQEVETFYNQEYKRDLSYKCLSSEHLEMILNMSLSFEEFLLPEWAKLRETQTSHREGFTEYIETNKFCELDFEETLAQQEWKDFFSKYLPKTLSGKP